MAEELKLWLEGIGLGGHAEAFVAQGVDVDVLGDLSDDDLKELGLSLGDRRRLQRAIARPLGGSALEPAPAVLPSPAVAHPGERRQLTVMFIDLIDSSPLAGKFDPELMRQILGEFHQACASAVEAHEGHIAQYSGDGLLVYFGYPRAHEDDAARAVRAGLEVIANLDQANARLEAEHAIRLQVRLGVETGLVVAGEVGAGSARDRQAIVGETPILAARLQAEAAPDTMVVGPATERLIHDSFRLESLGARQLKGISDPVQVWRVLQPIETAETFETRAVGGLTPLVGRAAELDLLGQRWKQACEGEMRGVLMIGEPGIGKSRMLRAFRDRCAGEEHQTIVLQCSAYHRDSPFWPVLQRLQRAFALPTGTFTEADVERLETALSEYDVDTAEAGLVLSNLFGMPTAGRYPAIDTAAPAFKRRTLDVLVALIGSLTRQAPVLMVVEDTHWIDPSTLELVRRILESLTGARLLLVLTARPEFKAKMAYPHLVPLNLDRLSRRDRLEMIESLTGGKPLPAAVMDQIVARTDGVPLFVEELTKAVLGGDLLRETGGRYEFSGTAQAVAIPDTLQGSLLSRLDRLDATVKEIAQMAASIGREFSRGLLSLIAAKPESELAAALERLTIEEIVLPAPGGAEEGEVFLFRHALIQEAAYQSLLLKSRRLIHGQIAEALETHYPEIVERQPELVARNLAESDRPQRAVEYWRRASEHACGRAAYEESLAHARRGLTLAEACAADAVLPLLLLVGGAEFRIGSRQAIDSYRRAAALARTQSHTSSLVEAALGVDKALMFLDDSVEAGIPLLDEALEAVGPEETVERCRLLSRLAGTLHVSGAFDRASQTTREAVDLARRLGDAHGLIDALVCELMQVGALPVPKTKFAGRRRILRELHRTAERHGDYVLIGNSNFRGLAAYLEIGDLDSFESTLGRCNQMVANSPELIFTWCGIGAEAMRAIMAGDFALGESKAEESLRLAESVEGNLSAGVYGMQMFTIRREQGRLAEVAPLIKRFVDDHPEDATWRPGLMLIASDLGFEPQARRTFDQMAEAEFSLPLDSKRLVTWTYLAEVAARLGPSAAAERVYAGLLPFKDQAVTVPAFTLCCGSAARYLGALAAALGDWSAAEAHFEYALAMNERLRAWPWLAHVRHEFALMLLARDRRGDRKRAADLLARSVATANSLGMFALEERIRGAATRSGPMN